MAERKVSIRLGTTGEAEVRRALDQIADTGDASARRLARSYERASEDVEAAVARQARAATKVSAFLPASELQAKVQDQAGTGFGKWQGSAKEAAATLGPLLAEQLRLEERARALVAVLDPAAAAQERYNAEMREAEQLYRAGAISIEQFTAAEERSAAARDRATGALARQNAESSRQTGLIGGGSEYLSLEGSAKRSAAAFEELLGAQDRVEARTRALMSAVDPAYAAQERFNSAIREATDLRERGAITEEQFTQVLRHEEAQLELTNAAIKRGATTSGQHASAMQNLSYQAQDAMVQLQAGTPVITVLTQQGTQAAAAMTGLGGAAGKFAAFMQTGWGLAITGGVILLGMLWTALSKTGDTIESETKKLEENAAKAKLADDAKKAFARTEAGIIDGIRQTTAELEKQNDALLTNAERMNIQAKNRIELLTNTRADLVSQLDPLRGDLAVLQRSPNAPGNQAGIASRTAQIDALETRIRDIDAAIATANVQLNRSRVDLANDNAKALLDPVEKVRRAYQDQIDDELRRQRAAADTGKAIGKASQDRLQQLYAEQKAAVEGEQKRQAALQQTATQLGRVISLGDARSIVEGIGGRVTSDLRSRAEQEALYAKYLAGTGSLAAKPGTSYHEAGEALDVAKSPGMTLEKLKAAFAADGVKLIELLDEGTHFHVAWSKKASLERQVAEQNEDAASEAKKRADELADLTRQFDPAAAAGERYAAVLAQIAKLDPANGDMLRSGAWIEYVKARASAFSLPDVEAMRPGYDANDEAERRRAEFVKSTLADQEDQLTIAQAELGLVGRSDQYRDAQITKLRLILQLQREGIDAESEQGKEILANADALAELARRQAQAQASWEEFKNFGEQTLDTIFDPSIAQTWGDRVNSILEDIQKEFIKLALLNPLKNMLFGESNATLGGVIGSVGKLFGGGSSWFNPGSSLVDPNQGVGAIPGGGDPNVRYATGTEWASGGRTLVGENGPEIVDMPKGSRVTPAAETRRLLAGNDNLTVHFAPVFDARGAGPREVDQLRAEMQQMRAELPGTIVETVRDARERRMIGR